MREITLLNQIVKPTETEIDAPCLQWEADSRHAEIVLAQFGLRLGKGSKRVTPPGVKRTSEELLKSPLLNAAETALFRLV
eukprot:1210794-Pyramimonas_sp.AAC.1